MENIIHLRQDWANLGDQMKALLDSAQAEKRDLTAEDQEKFDRMAADADKLEARIDRLENHQKRQERMTGAPPIPGGGEAESLAAFSRFVCTGQQRGLEVSEDTKGGFLVPSDISEEILKSETELCPFRTFARVMRIDGTAIALPKRTGQFAAQWVGETEERNETDGLRYGIEEVSTKRMSAMIDISNDMLEDSAFDMQNEILMEAAEQFAVAESQGFLTGNGVLRPLGVVNDPSGIDVNSGTNGDFDADDLIDLLYGLKGAYLNNAIFLFNRTTLRKIRKLKANNEYIWAPAGPRNSGNSIVTGIPGTILDRPYFVAPELADTGTAGNISVVVGDFRRGYRIVDRVGMTMTRDDLTQAKNNNVRFFFRKRVGGQIVMPEAIRRLKESA